MAGHGSECDDGQSVASEFIGFWSKCVLPSVIRSILACGRSGCGINVSKEDTTVCEAGTTGLRGNGRNSAWRGNKQVLWLFCYNFKWSSSNKRRLSLFGFALITFDWKGVLTELSAIHCLFCTPNQKQARTAVVCEWKTGRYFSNLNSQTSAILIIT